MTQSAEVHVFQWDTPPDDVTTTPFKSIANCFASSPLLVKNKIQMAPEKFCYNNKYFHGYLMPYISEAPVFTFLFSIVHR